MTGVDPKATARTIGADAPAQAGDQHGDFGKVTAEFFDRML